MNHPRRDVLKEIEWMAGLGLGFIDLTLEPPVAASWKVDAKAIRRDLRHRGVGSRAHVLRGACNFHSTVVEQVHAGCAGQLMFSPISTA